MKHTSIDQYASASSFHCFDPRAKLIAFTFFVVAVALIREPRLLLLSLFYIICLTAISSVPPAHIGKRYLLTLPFIFFASLTIYLTAGFSQSVSMFMRISTCVLALILLSSTTQFFDLLKGLQRLKAPGLLVSLLLLTYRYFFVVVDELQRMSLARKARGFGKGKHLLHKRSMQIISFTAGMVLVRSYERGNRLYDSLLSRGYDGKVRTLTKLRLRAIDYVLFLTLLSLSVLLLSMDWRLLPCLW